MKEMVLAMVAILLLGGLVLFLGLSIAEAVRLRRSRRALGRSMVVKRVSRRGYRVELVPLFRGREGRN